MFEKAVAFIKTPLAKKIAIAIVILLICIFIYNKYQRKIYNGYTKSEIIKEVASMYALSRIEAHSNEGFQDTTAMAIYYDDKFKPNIKPEQIKVYLSRLGVDYIKHPDLLKIQQKVNELSFLKDHI
jgi:hypothetical protein